jgi:hypothetical protein
MLREEKMCQPAADTLLNRKMGLLVILIAPFTASARQIQIHVLISSVRHQKIEKGAYKMDYKKGL